MGAKNPKLVVDNHDFLCAEKKVDKTVWRCSQYYYSAAGRCKAKLVTSGRIVQVIGEHNHESKTKKDKKSYNMRSQKVTIIRKPE